MQTFRIEGGRAIHGEVTPSGNKNAALPLLAACLLTDQPVVLRNVPDIGDVRTMCGLLESLGVQIERLDAHTWRVQAGEGRRADLDPDICRRMRADILLDEASVTATENAIMASVTARGETTLRNAASEPHVQDLCNFLNALGAGIENIGSNTLHIHGVERLSGGDFTIGADYLEVV